MSKGLTLYRLFSRVERSKEKSDRQKTYEKKIMESTTLVLNFTFNYFHGFGNISVSNINYI